MSAQADVVLPRPAPAADGGSSMLVWQRTYTTRRNDALYAWRLFRLPGLEHIAVHTRSIVRVPPPRTSGGAMRSQRTGELAGATTPP